MSWVLGPDDEVKNTVRELPATNKTMFLSTSANDRLWVAGVYFAESDIWEGDVEMLDDDEQLEAARHAVRAKAPEIELLKFRAAAVRLTIRHWRATDVTIGWRPGKELMPSMKPSPN